jgi:HK97 family phage prohead protease
MFIWTRNGPARIEGKAALLDFLRGELKGRGVGSEDGGVKRVTADIEMIASVPLCLSGGNDGKGVPWVFSTFDLDRFSERVDPAGWDYSQYLKNPVVEWAHRYDIPAIGKAEGLFADEKGLHGSVVFNDKEYDPFGWAIGQRVKAGVIRAGSVGFRILEIELPSKEDGKDGTALIFRKQELLEFSICNVPANPFALRKDLAGNNAAAGFPDFWGNIINNNTQE